FYALLFILEKNKSVWRSLGAICEAVREKDWGQLHISLLLYKHVTWTYLENYFFHENMKHGICVEDGLIDLHEARQSIEQHESPENIFRVTHHGWLDEPSGKHRCSTCIQDGYSLAISDYLGSNILMMKIPNQILPHFCHLGSLDFLAFARPVNVSLVILYGITVHDHTNLHIILMFKLENVLL
ncbi:hypothetical protein ACJX0J_007900, partial [Zea mays]